MGGFRLAIPPNVASVIRRLPPGLNRSVREALRAVGANPSCGERLRRELEGLWKYRVRRFRIVYVIDRTHRLVQVVAVGPRIRIYEELAETLRGRMPSR
jgi:mRNA interferase RelE/StbE